MELGVYQVPGALISSAIRDARPMARQGPGQPPGAHGIKCSASPKPEEVHHKVLDLLVAIHLLMSGPGKLL